MKVYVHLTDSDIRDAIRDKAYCMLPDEVLSADDAEVEIGITAYGTYEDGQEVGLDLSDPDDWSLNVNIKANDNPGHEVVVDGDDEDYE